MQNSRSGDSALDLSRDSTASRDFEKADRFFFSRDCWCYFSCTSALVRIAAVDELSSASVLLSGATGAGVDECHYGRADRGFVWGDLLLFDLDCE